MAGSKIDANYTTDGGIVYYTTVDKSNYNQVNGGATAISISTDGVPRNIRMRYAIYRSPDRLFTVKVPVATLALFAALPPTITNYSGIVCNLVNRVSERRRVASVADTGQTNP